MWGFLLFPVLISKPYVWGDGNMVVREGRKAKWKFKMSGIPFMTFHNIGVGVHWSRRSWLAATGATVADIGPILQLLPNSSHSAEAEWWAHGGLFFYSLCFWIYLKFSIIIFFNFLIDYHVARCTKLYLKCTQETFVTSKYFKSKLFCSTEDPQNFIFISSFQPKKN